MYCSFDWSVHTGDLLISALHMWTLRTLAGIAWAGASSICDPPSFSLRKKDS